jgi:membrane fusion protein (multidrug efflux system)
MKRNLQMGTAVVGLGLVLLCGCKRSGNTQTAGQSHTSEATPVQITVVSNAAWEKSVSIVGTLYPKDEATLAAQVEGTVERTLVDFGDRVQNEQDLAFIDTGSYEAQLEQAVGNLAKAEANLKNANQNFQRMENLRKDEVASESDYDLAKAQLSTAQAEVQAAKGAETMARLNLRRSRAKAPFDGAISQRIVGRGDFVHIGSPLFNIVNDSILKFIFQVPEKYASFVKKRLPVSFNVDNYPGETFNGTVYLISPSVSAGSRAFNVGALVTNTNFRLKANTFARGALILEPSTPTPVVPVDAVVTFAGVTKVFVAENNVARSRNVQTGRIRDGVQEITEGLKPGETVISSGQNRLSDGAPIRVQNAQASARSPLSPITAQNE